MAKIRIKLENIAKISFIPNFDQYRRKKIQS